jgi:hypothetical protein
MKLMGQSEVEAAVRFLKETAADTINQIVGERGVAVRLKKLDIMQGDACMQKSKWHGDHFQNLILITFFVAKARVLYIHIQDESENKVLDELCGKHLST